MKRVLLVDDDVDFCEATALLLESKAYEVILAHDGKQGLEKARVEKPDLVILDVMMPEMNGYDVCVVLKADPELKQIPVVLLTAVDQAIFRTGYSQHMGLMTEAEDYIAKPVESEELVKRVEALFR
ncbi:MAG: response regulator [Thermodesulfobacteriota bacterium]|nr:response regulator [Thermodesulfobacteriota bacterium]